MRALLLASLLVIAFQWPSRKVSSRHLEESSLNKCSEIVISILNFNNKKIGHYLNTSIIFYFVISLMR